MPVNSYECLFLIDPTKASTDMDGIKGQLHGTLEKYGAQIVASRKWDDRKLAYPIKGHKKGLYYLTYFRTEGKNLTNIERDLALNETVIRNMVLRVDPKLVDIMLQLAKDERAMALQTVNAPPAEDDFGGRDEGRGPRRPPRRPPGDKPEGEK